MLTIITKCSILDVPAALDPPLRAMYDLVEGNIRNLSSLGVPSDTYGQIISSFVN